MEEIKLSVDELAGQLDELNLVKKRDSTDAESFGHCTVHDFGAVFYAALNQIQSLVLEAHRVHMQKAAK